MPDNEIRIVMIGKYGAGKSLTGNAVLGYKAFKSKFSLMSWTTSCSRARGVVAGREVSVVETPGLFDPRFCNDDTIKEIKQCICLSAPGPHVFLLVIKLGRFTEEDKKSVEMIQEAFGQMSNKYTMNLFTNGDLLEGKPVEVILENSPILQDLIAKCEGRYHVFNNKSKDHSQVTELMEKIDKMVSENGGSHYTTEMFQEAEKAIEKEKQRILKENEEKRLEEEKELKTKHEREEREQEKKTEEEKQRIHKENDERFRKEIEELTNKRREEKRGDEKKKISKENEVEFLERLKQHEREEMEKVEKSMMEKIYKEQERRRKHYMNALEELKNKQETEARDKAELKSTTESP